MGGVGAFSCMLSSNSIINCYCTRSRSERNSISNCSAIDEIYFDKCYLRPHMYNDANFEVVYGTVIIRQQLYE